MARLRFRCLVLAFALLVPERPFAQQVPRTTALVGVEVVDVERGEILPRQVIVVRGDRIVSVAPVGTARVPRGARVVRAEGAYVIPGLWDMHVHHWADTRLSPDSPRMVGSFGVAYFQALFIAAGVTGVRDLGGDLAAIQETQRQIQRGERVGPRIVATGQKLGDLPVVPGAPFPLRTVEDVRRSVKLLRDSGAAHVKIEVWAEEPERWALEACRSFGMPCVAHVNGDISMEEVSDLGMRSLEHLFQYEDNVSVSSFEDFKRWRQEAATPGLWRRFFYKLRLRERPLVRLARERAAYDSVKADRLFRRLAQNGTWVTPTLIFHDFLTRVEPLDTVARNEAFMPYPLDQGFKHETRSAESIERARRVQARQFRLVREMHAAGVPMLAGTDTPMQSAPGFGLHGELALMQRAGLSPIDALRAATLEPARYFGATDTLGTVRAGRVADLVVLRGNPLENIRHTREIDMVMTRGRLLTRAQLDSLVAPANRLRQR